MWDTFCSIVPNDISRRYFCPMPWPGHNSKTGLSQELNDHFELFFKIAKAGEANMGSSGFPLFSLSLAVPYSVERPSKVPSLVQLYNSSGFESSRGIRW